MKKTPYKSDDGYVFESQELYEASTMRSLPDSWAVISVAFAPAALMEITYPNTNKTLTAKYFKERYDRILKLADLLEKSGDKQFKKCAAEVRIAIRPYREALEKYMAEK